MHYKDRHTAHQPLDIENDLDRAVKITFPVTTLFETREYITYHVTCSYPIRGLNTLKVYNNIDY